MTLSKQARRKLPLIIAFSLGLSCINVLKWLQEYSVYLWAIYLLKGSTVSRCCLKRCGRWWLENRTKRGEGYILVRRAYKPTTTSISCF
ncbi:hypothetical protein An11g02855 [Aspergillus niger]|uniref:Uncharacterized protein n=2 Tax=Aspergillus niger TaxID=5061 RepID=A2QVW3_ASPNC|nr:hypothetical protein An11g02855 [Aspergillus niger]CAK40617.1 hypothetical protein An11g02855 [Aspergillus niger]